MRLEEERAFDAFLDVYWEAIHAIERSLLGRIRVAVGHALGWDDAPNSRAIPGCTERLVAERLDASDRGRNRFARAEPSPLPVAKVSPVYRFEDEVLYEVSNATVHALMHISCAPGAAAELAIYVKSRGLLTRLYMAAIAPARYAIVYPALVSQVERRWRRARPGVA